MLERDSAEAREKITEITRVQSEDQWELRLQELQRTQESLASQQQSLTSAILQREELASKLTASLRDQDFRRKNAEQLLPMAEKENKERIEEHVRVEKELSDWRKKTNEYAAEIRRIKKDGEHEAEMTGKREEQVGLLMIQLQKREAEQELLKRELARRDEEQKRLQEELISVQARSEQQFPSPRDLQEARGLAEARAGETQTAKEAIKTYHQQLRLKEGEISILRKKAEAKSVRLPPLQSASGRRGTQDVIRNRKSVTSETPGYINDY